MDKDRSGRKMTEKDAARIQSATAKKNEGAVKKGSFASRAQSSAAHNSSLNKK